MASKFAEKRNVTLIKIHFLCDEWREKVAKHEYKGNVSKKLCKNEYEQKNNTGPCKPLMLIHETSDM